jgi:hypothetical protein
MAWAYPLAIVIVTGSILWFLVHIVGEIVKVVQGAIPTT